MYLSKVHIGWSQARNPYEWHRALWSLFPEQPAGERPFLFRVEQQVVGKGTLILLQSRLPPSPVGSAARLLGEPKLFDLPELPRATALRFRLTANVIKAIHDASDAERSIRVPLIHEEQQTAWLKRKLASAGNIEAVTVVQNPPLYFRRKGQGGKIVAMTFDGTLRMLDRDALRALLETGVGAAKSFGCGLLSLARS